MDGSNKEQQLIAQAKQMNIWTEAHDEILKTSGSKLLCEVLEPAILLAMQTKIDTMKTEYRLLLAGSMKETYYMKEDGSFRLPPMETNSFVEPSIGSRQATNDDEPDRDATTAKLKIPNATIVSPQSNIWLEAKEVKVPIKKDNGVLLVSYMGGPSGNLTYMNELDVQMHVMNLLKDAIRALGLEEEACVRAQIELAYYTLRPDRVLVVKCKGRMIFTVIVKSPGVGNEVFESNDASGQLWSYLLANKQLGNDVPMGALVTYNKMVLATLDDCGNKEGHEELLQHARDTLKSGVQPRRSSPSNKKEECRERQESRVQQETINATTQAHHAVKGENDDEEIEMECNLFYSRVFSNGEVFPALLQALEMAYHRCQRVDIQVDLPVVHPGDDLGRRLFFKVGSDGYTFVLMRNHFRVHTGALCALNTNHFYLLSKVGEVYSGVVYHACDTSGRLCTIKVYRIDKSTAPTEQDREQVEQNRMRACAKGVAKRDVELWEKVYGNRFAGVRQLQLGGRPCLLLPYGIEIGTEANRRNYLPAIEEELERIACMGLGYEGSDICWQHVLLDPDSNMVFLSDLESMYEFRGVDTKKVVRDAMEVFTRTCSDHCGNDRANDLRLKRSVEEVEEEEPEQRSSKK